MALRLEAERMTHTRKQVAWGLWAKLLLLREQIKEPMSLFKRAADSANMADIKLDCYDAISSTARTQKGHLRFVQDILQTRWREAEAEARVAQLRCRRIAKYFDALCKRQAELQQTRRTAERVRLHWVRLASSLARVPQGFPAEMVCMGTRLILRD